MGAALTVLLAVFAILIAASPRDIGNENPIGAENAGIEELVAEPIASAAQRIAVNPDRIARRFPRVQVVVAEPPRPEPESTKKAPNAASPWLSYLGIIEEDGGSKEYMFKDGRTGRILQLSVGKREAEWKLVSIENGVFTIEEDGARYEVPYRR